jgi:rRNA maturation endonuclease Nob1
MRYIKKVRQKDAMSSKQVWLTKTPKLDEVIVEAHKTFPDAGSDSQAIVRALFHWFHNRQQNSKRGAIDEVAKDVKELKELMELTPKINEVLAILRGQHDTDHG